MIASLLELPIRPRVLILSSFDYEEEIYRAAKAGASGYLMKDATRAQIVQAIHAWPRSSFPQGHRCAHCRPRGTLRP